MTRAIDITEVWPDSIRASSHELGWRGLRAIHARRGPGDARLPAFENHCLIVHLGAAIDVEGRVDCATFAGRLGRGAISVIPAGVASEWRLLGPGDFEAFFVFLPQSTLSAAAAACDVDGAFAIEARLGIDDPQLVYAGLSLLYELTEPNAMGRHYAEPYAALLALQLVKRHGVLREARARRGGIAPLRLRRVLERMNGAVDNEELLVMSDMAEVAGLGYHHFFRAFKQSMGASPNQYILERRIERAKLLLATTDAPIAEIALRVGFSSQSHFTATFGRLVGATPRTFRVTS